MLIIMKLMRNWRRSVRNVDTLIWSVLTSLFSGLFSTAFLPWSNSFRNHIERICKSIRLMLYLIQGNTSRCWFPLIRKLISFRQINCGYYFLVWHFLCNLCFLSVDGDFPLFLICYISCEKHFALLQDFCEVCPEKLPNYEEKIKNFFEEHLHTDEEIRYCVAGSGMSEIVCSLIQQFISDDGSWLLLSCEGFFDVRDQNDAWIRVWVKKGGMIVLPAGIYHRFTLDTDNYIKVLRSCLFRSFGCFLSLFAA